MPALSNPRHERFAQELAKGKSAYEAYELAGFNPNAGNASTLKAKQNISKRISEIQAERVKIDAKATEKAADRLSLTREWVLTRMMKNARVALGEDRLKITVVPKDTAIPVEVEVSAHDAQAANRALELLGRELNLFIAKSEVGNPGDFDRLSDGELDERISLEKAELVALVNRKAEAREQEDSGQPFGRPN